MVWRQCALQFCITRSNTEQLIHNFFQGRSLNRFALTSDMDRMSGQWHAQAAFFFFGSLTLQHVINSKVFEELMCDCRLPASQVKTLESGATPAHPNFIRSVFGHISPQPRKFFKLLHAFKFL